TPPGGLQSHPRGAGGVVGVAGLDDARSSRIARVERESRQGSRRPLRRPVVTSRRASVLLADALLAVAANYLAFWLRFDGTIPVAYWMLWLQTVPCLVLIRGLT